MYSTGGDGEDKEGRGRKVPSGFEKILKRTRKGITHDKETPNESASKGDEESKSTDEEKKAAEEEKKEEADAESDGE